MIHIPKDLPREALLHYSKTSGKPVVECLANLVKEALLSDTDDPLHVYGPEFIQLLDDALGCYQLDPDGEVYF